MSFRSSIGGAAGQLTRDTAPIEVLGNNYLEGHTERRLDLSIPEQWARVI